MAGRGLEEAGDIRMNHLARVVCIPTPTGTTAPPLIDNAPFDQKGPARNTISDGLLAEFPAGDATAVDDAVQGAKG